MVEVQAQNLAAGLVRTASSTHEDPQLGKETQLRDQDRLLPVANIARIMVQELPEGTKISRDAKAIMQEAVSEFICFVVSEVADNCNGESKRTMHGVDIIEALEALGPTKACWPHSVGGRAVKDAGKNGLAEGYGAVTRAMMPYLSSSSANSAKQKRSLSSDAHTTSLSPSSKRRPTMGAA
eukprot:6212695-Pleurochrysis_carterae.AAC.3